MELSGSNIQKFLIFREMEIPKKIPYISGNGNAKKLLIFWETKLFLYFGKWKPRKSSLYFRRNFQGPKNQNFIYFSKKRFE